MYTCIQLFGSVLAREVFDLMNTKDIQRALDLSPTYIIVFGMTMKLVFSISFSVSIVMSLVGCATPSQGERAKISNSETNSGCSFDSECPSGNCQFGKCSMFSNDTSSTPASTGPQSDMSPKLVIPSTGGPPVIGIPTGGDTFIPTTGGPPIVGIPTGP